MAKLDAATRNALPSKDFAEPKERKFPINDASHARDALSRASAKGPGVEVSSAGEGEEEIPRHRRQQARRAEIPINRQGLCVMSVPPFMARGSMSNLINDDIS